MVFGLGVLRLPPTAFWSMTLPELIATGGISVSPADAGFRRQHLESLMARFPDTAAESKPTIERADHATTR